MARSLTRWLWPPVAAGIAGALAFPFVVAIIDNHPLLDRGPREIGVFICGAFLFQTSQAATPIRARMGRSFVCGVSHFGVLLYWLDIAMTQYAGMAQWQAIPVLVLLVSYCALYWALIPLVTVFLQRHTALPSAVAFAFAIVSLEWLRGTLCTGFPWGTWGYALVRDPLLLQLSAIGGASGLSWIVAIGSVGLALLWRFRKQHAARTIVGWLVAGTVLLHTAGWARSVLRAPDEALGLRVAVVQPNIDQHTKNRGMADAPAIKTRLFELTRRAEASRPDLIVWPEAAWPGGVAQHASELPEVVLRTPLLMGSTTHGRDPAPVAFNSAFYLAPGGHLRSRYNKRRLVPFGEYVPLRWLLPVNKIVPGLVEFSPGQSAEPIGTPPVGVLICYDGIFSTPARKSVDRGAAILANLTNDGWYGVSSAPYQHRDFYRLRAVETDRWLIRAANSGVSLFIGPDGTMHHPTRLNETAVVSNQVWPRQTQTFFVRRGDWVGMVARGVLLGGVLGLLWTRTHRWRHRLRRVLTRNRSENDKGDGQ